MNGRPARHGARVKLSDPATWPEPDSSTGASTTRYGAADIRAWHRLHPTLTHRSGWLEHEGELPILPGTLIRLEVEHLPGNRDPDPVWLWCSTPEADQDLVTVCWTMFLWLDQHTVSTATDQMLLAQAVMAVPTLAHITGEKQATLPVAGTVHNTNGLLGHDGVVGVKTGYTSHAGGYLVFAVRADGTRGHQGPMMYGVILGQPGDSAQLSASGGAADRLIVAAWGSTARERVPPKRQVASPAPLLPPMGPVGGPGRWRS
jgi:hypothetical protein